MTPLAQPTAGYIPRQLPHASFSAPAGHFGDHSYSRDTPLSRTGYFTGDYSAQTENISHLHTPTSMTGHATQHGSYLPSNVGSGMPAGSDDTMPPAFDQPSYPGELTISRPASTQPGTETLLATAPSTTSCSAPYGLSTRPSSSMYSYPDSVTATSLSHPYPPFLPTSTSLDNALDGTMLNSAYTTAGGYPSQHSDVHSNHENGALPEMHEQQSAYLTPHEQKHPMY